MGEATGKKPKPVDLEAFHSPRRVIWWWFVHCACYLWFLICYRIRDWRTQRVPREGGVLFVSNHQSFYDPIILGLALHRRRFFAMARTGLFNNMLLRWMITSMNAVPVERGEADMAAMRFAIDVLKNGYPLVIFPEGSRSPVREVAEFQAGTMLLIKRAKPTVVPVAIEGAHDVWPRGQMLPWPVGRIGLMVGEPIEARDLLAMGAKQGLAHLHTQVETMRQDLARKLEITAS